LATPATSSAVSVRPLAVCLLSAVLLLPFAAAIDAIGQGQARAELGVRIVKQPYMLCLAASVSMVLEYWGHRVTPAALAEQVAVYKGGTTGSDYVKIVEALGFHAFLIQPPFEDLLGHLDKNRPVIVSLPERGGRHAMVLVGYDLPAGKVWLNDPAAGERKAHAIDAFRRQWEKGDRWTLLIVPR